MTTTPPEGSASSPLTFDQCLDAIEQYRAGGCGGAAYKALLRTHGAAWRQIDTAFEAHKTDAAFWNGQNAPATGSDLYNKIIKGLNFTADIMPHPFRAAFLVWAQEKPYLRDYLKKIAKEPNEAVHYDLFRADMLEAFGQDLMAKGNSHMFAHANNNHYVTELSDGSWKVLSDDQVAEMIRSGGKGGPHVFMTANHAFLETMNDVAGTVDNYKKLIHEVTHDKVTNNRAKIGTYDKQPLTSDQTIMVVALNTRENNYLNLAQLFHRLHEIDVANEKGPEHDPFIHVAPTAKLMVRTILKSIVEDPSRITEGIGTPPSFVSGDTPVKLKPDAAEIIRNTQLHGFSKGGNDFRDGMRLLARTMNLQNAKGEPLFQTDIPARDIRKDIVSNISVTVQSMNEKPMHNWYKDRGVAVTYFTNRRDSIALPPDFDFESAEPAVVYYGGAKASGHYPAVITENLSHPYILQHYRCAMAKLTEEPAVRFVLYETIGDRHCLVLKTAPGTTDAMMEQAIPIMEAAFNKVGLQDHQGNPKIKIRRIEGAHGCERYELYSTEGKTRNDQENDLLSRGTILKLTDAFDAMRYDLHIPVVISSAITDPCLPTLGKDVVIAKRGYDGMGKGDWKDHIVVTGGQVYDHRIGQINKFMGPEPNMLPEDPPQMSGNGAARAV